MSSLTQAVQRQATSPTLWVRLRAHLTETGAAHAKQARFGALSRHDARDVGLSPEDILAEQAYDPALPFFFQSGFGRQ